MSKTAWELATEHFYEWDHHCRGYHHFDRKVNIEPPYKPFIHKKSASLDTYIDDGKIPGIWESFANMFSSKKIVKKKITPKKKLTPNSPSSYALDTGFRIVIPENQDSSVNVFTEFIHMLSSSKAPIAFEVIGTFKNISIQIVFSEVDETLIKTQIKAFFPLGQVQKISITDVPFSKEESVVICDFGLKNECVRPIKMPTSFQVDPLVTLISKLDSLSKGETVMFQIICKSVTNPWKRDIQYAVLDGQGERFFVNSPEMMDCAKEKTSSLLLSCIIRLAIQAKEVTQSKLLAKELINNISIASNSEFNTLIPLSNEGYSYKDHLKNVYQRTTNRYGMLLNSIELTTFLHYPISLKIKHQSQKKKQRNTDEYNSLLNYVKKIALQKKFVVNTEKKEENGARVDIEIVKGTIKIAIEVSLKNTLEDEVLNIQKCIDSAYTQVFMLSGNTIHLKNIKKRALEIISQENLKKVKFLNKFELITYLDFY